MFSTILTECSKFKILYIFRNEASECFSKHFVSLYDPQTQDIGNYWTLLVTTLSAVLMSHSEEKYPTFNMRRQFKVIGRSFCICVLNCNVVSGAEKFNSNSHK